MSAPALLTQWARLLLGSLRRAGLRQVVVSPGSRSTPFTWAALQEPGLDCRTFIDERSAAFFALGHARVTGEPALLVCTSGTAAANYFPAVVEAAEAGLPLLVLTADRPLELQHAAAPQTIDQVELYGGFARGFFELGTPDPDARMLRAVPRLAAQAMLASRSPLPGPVQLNARARKPLEPVEPAGPDDERVCAAVDRLLERVPDAAVPDVRPDAAALDRVAAACAGTRRGIIVCGPAAAPDAASAASVGALARATGFPVVAESASQLRFADLEGVAVLDAFPALLEVPAFADAHAPELILQIGRPPTASSWIAAIDRWEDARRYVLAPHGWPDPWSAATAVLQGRLDGAVEALARAVAGSQAADGTGPDRSDAEAGRRSWSDRLERADRRARSVIDDALTGAFSEGAAVRTVVDRLPRGAVLALGNSLPIREVDTFVPASDRGLVVCTQRGASGIDGLISGAAGAAAASGRPTTLILGDVSFVHDIGGLHAVRDLPAPLTIVVLDNGGGRIFERLPIADTLAGDPAMDAWLTPPGVDLAHAVAAFGLPFGRADDIASLRSALDRLAESGGVIQVEVPEAGTTRHQRELRRRLEAELG